MNHGKKDPSVNFPNNSYVISREQSESYPLVQEKQGWITYVTSTWLPYLIFFPSDIIPKFFLVHVLSGMLNFNVGNIKALLRSSSEASRRARRRRWRTGAPVGSAFGPPPTHPSLISLWMIGRRPKSGSISRSFASG